MPRIVRFDHFEIDLESAQLRKCGIKVKLREQSFQVLAYLLEHPGRLVTREELRKRLWDTDVFVDFDNNLNIVIARLREALGDSAERPRFIETCPKHGYRFIAEVKPLPVTEVSLRRSRTRLVVLPLANFSKDPSQDYIADALTDSIIASLASLAPEQLAVIACTTAMHYKGSRKDVAHIARELNVDYVVEGGICPVGDHVSVNIQLIQASDQTHLFARKYDVATGDVFKLNDSIVLSLAGNVPCTANRAHLTSIGPASASKHTDDPMALSEYVQGRKLMDLPTSQSLSIAKEHLEKAIARDSEFAPAYDALAEAYWYLGYFGYMRPRDAFAAGIVHAVRAIEIDNSRAETHALLGQFHKIAEYNWNEVQREMTLALRLDPASPLVRMRHAVSGLMPHGRVDEAARELEHVLEVDPLSVWARLWLGIMLLLGRHFERALVEGCKFLELYPFAGLAYFVIANCHRYLGKVEDSIACQRKAAELSNDSASMLGWLGLTLASVGQQDEARAILQQLDERRVHSYVPSSSLAWIYLGLHELDDAFEWMNRAVEDCDQFMMPIKTYAFLDPIRDDPRFAELLRKMNLAN